MSVDEVGGHSGHLGDGGHAHRGACLAGCLQCLLNGGLGLFPASAGGCGKGFDDPNDPRNLWVEPPDPGHKAGSGVNNRKDPVETKLHTAVCVNKVTLAAAQRAIVADWTTALSTLGLG